MRDYFERAAVVKSGKLSKALLLTSPPSSSMLVSSTDQPIFCLQKGDDA